MIGSREIFIGLLLSITVWSLPAWATVQERHESLMCEEKKATPWLHKRPPHCGTTCLDREKPLSDQAWIETLIRRLDATDRLKSMEAMLTLERTVDQDDHAVLMRALDKARTDFAKSVLSILIDQLTNE